MTDSETMFDQMPKQGTWHTHMSKFDTALASLTYSVTTIFLLASPALLLGLYRAVL